MRVGVDTGAGIAAAAAEKSKGSAETLGGGGGATAGTVAWTTGAIEIGIGVCAVAAGGIATVGMRSLVPHFGHAPNFPDALSGTFTEAVQ